MFLCICNGIRESDFRNAARCCSEPGAQDLYARLGKQPQCGQCLDDADEIIEEERSGAAQPQLIAA